MARWDVAGVVVVRLVDAGGRAPPAPFFELRHRSRHATLAAAIAAARGHA
jgi:hypothetical protein